MCSLTIECVLLLYIPVCISVGSGADGTLERESWGERDREGGRESGGERAGEREGDRGGRREREREKVIVGVWEEGRKEGRNHQNFSLG